MNLSLRYLVAFAVLAVAGSMQVEAIEITEGPVARAIGPGQMSISWTTDVPGDTKLEYGADWTFGMTQYFPNPTTSHMVQIGGPTGSVFCFKTSSSDGVGTAEVYDWEILPTHLAAIRRPADYQPVITGNNIRIAGTLNDVYAVCQSADFFVTNVQTSQQTYIGTDIDGTEWTMNMDIPSIDGDGWSAYWNTTGLSEGEYDLMTVMHTTDIGDIPAQRRIYWDPSPPFPTINSPTFVDFVGGTVPISGDPIDAVTCDFFFDEGDDPPPPRFPTVPIKQRDYGWVDNKGGVTMCEPTAEASALWAALSEAKKEELRNAPKGSPPPGYTQDQLAIRYLVKICAQKKRTLRDNGTTDSGEESGTEKILDWLDLNWKYHNYDNVGYNKLKGLYRPKTTKAIVLHIQIAGKNAHSVALKNIDDTDFEEGNPPKKYHRVTFMDPDTGEDVTVNMDDNGNFDYPQNWTPPGKSSLPSIGVWTDVSGGGGRAPRSASTTVEDWTLIGTDIDPSDGISASWDTTGLAPGLYWIRASAVDALGHTGEDMVEVAIPAYPAKLSECKSQPDGTPVVVSGKTVAGLFGDSFWIEENDRSSGVRATKTGDALAPGYIVTVKGFMTTNGLEREIQVSDLTVVSTDITSNPAPKPLGMNNRAVGGGNSGYSPGPPASGQMGTTDSSGLNNVGLLVRTFGKVLSADTHPDLGPYVVIHDGSPGSEIRVYTSETVIPGDFKIFTGMAGLYQDATSNVRGAIYTDSGGSP